MRSLSILAALICSSTLVFAEDSTLKAQLDAKKAAFEAQAPAETLKIYDDGIKAVAESGIYEKAKNVGDSAPDFTLNDDQGKPVTLSEMLEDGPVVLTWYRGGWCPYCNIALIALQEKLPEFKALGAELVALTPELPDYASDTVKENKLEFTVLTDLHSKVAKDYGVLFEMTPEVASAMRKFAQTNVRNDDESDTLPLSATYIIDTNGKITYAFLDAEYRNRAEPSELVEELKKLK